MICECSINLANFAANFEFGAIKSSDFSTLILSILISIATVYVFSSIHKLQLILRVIISIVIISISINLFNECFLIFNLDNVEIYPKENYCVISIPLKHNKKFIWIADRKPNQKYYHDKALVRYINKNSSNIATIAYSGNFGKEFANSIATDKYAVRILDFSSQREIELRYLKGAYISKL